MCNGVIKTMAEDSIGDLLSSYCFRSLRVALRAESAVERAYSPCYPPVGGLVSEEC